MKVFGQIWDGLNYAIFTIEKILILLALLVIISLLVKTNYVIMREISCEQQLEQYFKEILPYAPPTKERKGPFIQGGTTGAFSCEPNAEQSRSISMSELRKATKPIQMQTGLPMWVF